MLAAWAVGILGSSEPAMERRAYSRPIEQDFDRMAHAMIADGRNTSAIMLHVEDLPSLSARRLVDHLRANLRACELVGAIGDGDVAVLLFNVSAEESTAIAARLRNLTEEHLVGGAEPVHVGTAYYPAGSAAAGPILAAARTAARLGVPTISAGRESPIAPSTN
jgi:GGDEF domain-containing protein